MGMKVDETIIQAKLLKDGVGKDTYKYEILTSLIDIAKKYQKIEEIYERFQKDGGYYHHMARLVDALREVLEDENDGR